MFFRRLKFNISDSCSMAFLLIAVISEYLFEIFVVLPVTEEGLIPLYIHVTLGTFVFINILFNFAMVMLEDTTTRKIILPSLLQHSWHYCSACEANSPPRTFHCEKCKACILKRDHHCAFAGCCVGLKNFRFFMLFLLYLSIGCIYATVFNMYFIWNILGGFTMFSVAAHIVPFIFYLFGYLKFTVFAYTMLSMLSIVGFLFVTNLFIFHARQMIHNQTTFEKNQSIWIYNLGWRKNIVEALGSNWHLIWICPLIKSTLPSDGLSFSSNHNSEMPSASNQFSGNIRHRNL